MMSGNLQCKVPNPAEERPRDKGAGRAACRARLFCVVKPRVRRVVLESLSDKEERKTPFAIMKVRCANCTRKAKGGHSE